MAKQRFFMQNPETWLHSYVYEAFRPGRLGRVQMVRKKTGRTGFDLVRVLWEDGTESEVSVVQVERIDDLIEDHRRKLTKHQEHLSEVKKVLERNE